MRNVSSIISGHNKFVLSNEHLQPETRTCNCRQQSECPMNGNCLARNIVYCGEVVNHTDNRSKPYVGLTSVSFKDRLGVHNQGIRHRSHAMSCELTKHVWDLKDSNTEFTIKWNILEHVKGRLIGGECRLCVTEKLHIIDHLDQAGLSTLIQTLNVSMGGSINLFRLGTREGDGHGEGRIEGL